MSHPIEPQGRRDSIPAADRSSVSAGNYQGREDSARQDSGRLDSGRLDSGDVDPTINLRGGTANRAAARDRAEFDQEFDDQSRLREQTSPAPGTFDRNYGGAGIPDQGRAYDGADGQDRTVRTDPGGADGTMPASGAGAAGRDLTLPADGPTSGADPALTTARYPVADQHSMIDDDRTERAMPTTIPPDRQTVAAREKERFGGMSFGSGFFGWLTATGMAVLLITLVAAAGVALGIASDNPVDQVVQDSQTDSGTAQTVGLVGGILLLVILFVAYFCGGYVAGRMARFSGAKQGLAVWLWALITTAIIAGIAAIAGSQYNVLAQLNLPRIPVDEGSVTTAGIIAIGAAILVALIGALLGGVVGTRFHRKVDAVGFSEDYPAL